MVLSLARGLCVGLCLLLGTARADSATTRDSLERLEELLILRVEDGRLAPTDLMPAILVSAEPRTEDSRDWYATRAIEVLDRAFGGGSETVGSGGLRLCEACMAPRVWVHQGQLEYQTGPVGLDEIVALDDRTRGEGPRARSAIWLDEHRGGVSLRIVDLHSGRVLFAQNVDPQLVESANTRRTYTMSEELDRRARGDSLTQAFVDFALYPGQHISLDWTEQWGPTNANLTGISISAFDPVIGIGAAHYWRMEIYNTLLGGKLLLSVPTAAARAVGDDLDDVLDPLVTVVGVARVPFGRSNYGAVITASTNGEVGIGVSLLNISLLPVLP